MTFFDSLKNGAQMTENDRIDVAKQLYDHIKTVCVTRKKMGWRFFEQTWAWYYHEFSAWQNVKSGFYFAALGNPEEELPGYKDDFAECTEQNRNAILARLKELLKADGFPEGSVFPITVKFKNGFRYLIKIDVEW